MAKRINIDTNLAATMDAPKPDVQKLKVPKVKRQKNNFEIIESFLTDTYEFRLNEISVEIEVREKDGGEWEVLNENNIYYTLYKAGHKSFQSIVQVLLKNDFTRSKYNPVKAYFNQLPKYDPSVEPDYIDQFMQFIVVEPSETALFRENLKKAFVRIVAAATGRIKFNKQCMILQGKQNDGKSSFIRYLVPEFLGSKYYTDSFDPENKDSVKHLATCFIINIDEMAGLNNKDINKLKTKMSYENVKMRLPYDKTDSDLPRLASFFGTTNEDEFLTDSTGSVRWLVFKVNKINHDHGGVNGYCSVPIDKVYAQALHLLNSDFGFKLSDDDLREMERVNRQYQVSSPEKEYLQRYFEPCEPNEAGGVVLQSTEMVEYIKGQHRDLIINPVSFGKALTFLKFAHGQKSIGKYQVKGRWTRYIDQPAPPTSFPTVAPPLPLSKKPPVTGETVGKLEILEKKRANLLEAIKKGTGTDKQKETYAAALVEVEKDIEFEKNKDLPF